MVCFVEEWQEAGLAPSVVRDRLQAVQNAVQSLAAGRLCEAFGKPSVAFKQEGEKYVASARAPEGFHLTDALDSMRELDADVHAHGRERQQGE